MNWIIPAIFSPALYALVIFIDKYIIEKKMGSFWGLPIFTSITGLLFGFIFWWISGFAVLPAKELILILLVGGVTLLGTVLYFKAISSEDSSLIIILLQMHPAILLLLASIFLNELITLKQYIGFFLVLGPSVILSMNAKGKFKKGGIKISRAFWEILAAGLMWSIGVIIFKPISQEFPLITLAAYESWGIFLGGLILYATTPIVRYHFRKNIGAGGRVFSFVLFNESLSVGAKLIGYLAFSLGPVALVSSLGGTQVLFGIFLGIVLTKFFPNLILEDLRNSTLKSKLGWSAIMLTGLWFIQ